jgi:hypothetical protein
MICSSLFLNKNGCVFGPISRLRELLWLSFLTATTLIYKLLGARILGRRFAHAYVHSLLGFRKLWICGNFPKNLDQIVPRGCWDQKGIWSSSAGRDPNPKNSEKSRPDCPQRMLGPKRNLEFVRRTWSESQKFGKITARLSPEDAGTKKEFGVRPQDVIRIPKRTLHHCFLSMTGRWS